MTYGHNRFNNEWVCIPYAGHLCGCGGASYFAARNKYRVAFGCAPEVLPHELSNTSHACGVKTRRRISNLPYKRHPHSFLLPYRCAFGIHSTFLPHCKVNRTRIFGLTGRRFPQKVAPSGQCRYKRTGMYIDNFMTIHPRYHGRNISHIINNFRQSRNLTIHGHFRTYMFNRLNIISNTHGFHLHTDGNMVQFNRSFHIYRTRFLNRRLDASNGYKCQGGQWTCLYGPFILHCNANSACACIHRARSNEYLPLYAETSSRHLLNQCENLPIHIYNSKWHLRLEHNNSTNRHCNEVAFLLNKRSNYKVS